MTKKQLTDEELNKASGGANVSTLHSFNKGDSHIYDYPGGSAHIRLTIEEIDDSRFNPFHLKLEYMRSNYQVYLTEDTWMTLDDLKYFWS